MTKVLYCVAVVVLSGCASSLTAPCIRQNTESLLGTECTVGVPLPDGFACQPYYFGASRGIVVTGN